jgi:hypothetical protein
VLVCQAKPTSMAGTCKISSKHKDGVLGSKLTVGLLRRRRWLGEAETGAKQRTPEAERLGNGVVVAQARCRRALWWHRGAAAGSRQQRGRAVATSWRRGHDEAVGVLGVDDGWLDVEGGVAGSGQRAWPRSGSLRRRRWRQGKTKRRRLGKGVCEGGNRLGAL